MLQSVFSYVKTLGKFKEFLQLHYTKNLPKWEVTL